MENFLELPNGEIFLLQKINGITIYDHFDLHGVILFVEGIKFKYGWGSVSERDRWFKRSKDLWKKHHSSSQNALRIALEHTQVSIDQLLEEI